MLSNRLNPLIINNQIRCCASNVNRLTNLLKVMKKEPGRSSGEDLFAARLNLFNLGSESQLRRKQSENLWSELEREELKLINQKPAKNGFEEMINWTNEGKLWKYPINNEDGLDKLKKQEKFYDHVFFDDLIEQSPDKQPIREFMNDAALGLGKNPHMTAERKRDYLKWYNDYFNEEKALVDTLVDEDEITS